VRTKPLRRYLMFCSLAVLILAATATLAVPCQETQGENVLCGRTCSATFPKNCNPQAPITTGCMLLTSGSGCINGPFPVCNCTPGM
jgi:hypothetical protein